mmetsp:Transcript_12422/g.30086  ORF Transcript_12422/g.30086 Transcript_12422/m.30086 type:complete len:333 (+) Transcript_12422:33-1031(+)
MGCAHSHQDSWTAGGLTDSQVGTLNALSTTFSSISFIGSSLIILCYLCFPSLRKFAFKLVFFLSLSDAMSTIGEFVGTGLKLEGGLPDSCSVCLFQAWLTSIFDLASVLWTACIAHCLWRAIRYHDLEVHRFEKYYHLFAFGVPVFLALLPQLVGAYGLENGQCWILSSWSSLMFIQFYIPLWCVVIFNVGIFYRIFRNLRGFVQPEDTQMRSPEETKMFWRLGLYPVILVVCWSVGTIVRIHNSITSSRKIFGLYALHSILGHCQGLFNCCVYGMNGAVRDKLKSVYLRLLGRPGSQGHFPGSDMVELTEAEKEDVRETSTEAESRPTVAV